MRRVIGLAVVALGSAGCPDRSISKDDPVPAAVFSKEIPVSADLDVLFVIDDSSSTRDKQVRFAENYKRFVDKLEGFAPRPNLHLGVVTTSVDVGAGGSGFRDCHPTSDEDGRLQHGSGNLGPACVATADRYLSDIARPDGTRQINYATSLAEALTCISSVGQDGCGFEAPLEAMKRALDGSHPENAGFLRRDAFLAVVILTDEDDCSADPRLFTPQGSAGIADDFRCTHAAYRCDQPISPSMAGAYTGCSVRRDSLLTDPTAYATFLTELKGPARVVVAVIGGTPTSAIETGEQVIGSGSQHLALKQSCQVTVDGQTSVARPAIRLDDFRKSFGDHGLFQSVCQADYGQAVTDIGTLVLTAISPCLEGTLETRDVDLASPGLQLDCSVSDVQDPEGGPRTEQLIPRCAMRAADQPDRGAAPACWWVQPDPACSTATQLALRVERGIAPPPGTAVHVSCVGAPAP